MPVISFRPLVVAAVLSLAAAGLSHAGTPSGEAASDSPKQVILTFDIPVREDQVDAEVTAPDGTVVATARSEGATLNGDTLTIPLPPLKPGVYLVAWSCKYGVGQVSEGKYTITVHATKTY